MSTTSFFYPIMISNAEYDRLSGLGIRPNATTWNDPPPEVAPSSFSTGPKDEVATADIYSLGKNISRTITSVKSLGLDAQSKLDGFFNDSSELANFLEKGKDKIGLEFNESILTQRLLETSSEIKGAFADLTASVKNGAKFNIAKQKVRDIQCTINDVKSSVSAAKIRDLRSLGGFINKYTKKSIFSATDTGAMSGLLASVVEKSESLGIKGAYTSLMDTIQDNALLRGITKTLVPIALAKGYPNLLRQISTSPWGSAVNFFVPGATQKLLKDFSLKPSSNIRVIGSFEDLLITIDGVEGAWSRSAREGSDEDVFDIFSIMGGSKDFQRLLYSGVQHFYSANNGARAHTPIVTPNGAKLYALYGLAAHYAQTTPAAAAKRYFPIVALTGTYDTSVPRAAVNRSRTSVRSTSSSVTDARLLNHAIGSIFS